ncbi:MAG: cation:proton antiporter [Rhodobacteraceae bacterium]|nr:cation:proton antiporter [Paracoccaceae bacterium]
MDTFLLLATVFLSAAVLAVPIARRVGLGSVLGYLLAGIVVGQFMALVGIGAHGILEFAEFGIVMLLFVIGLEIQPRTLWEMRHRLLGLGGLQIGATTAAIAIAGYLLGFPWPTALAVGMTLALSSTAMVMQTLSEKGLTHTVGGRSSLFVLLTQDVAVIPMLVIIPFLAAPKIEPRGLAAESAMHGEEGVDQVWTMIETLPGWGVAGVMLASILFIIVGGHFLVRPLFGFVSSSRLMEVSTAATLLLVVGTALLMKLVGLSPALGTFLAGVVLANSEFRHEMKSNIEPFKGLLLGLFFLMVGASMDFGVLFSNIIEVVGIAFGLIIIKLCVLYSLALIFSIKGRDRWLFTLGLAQAGEFGLVLISFMSQTHVIDPQHSEILLLVVALSMVLTPALFIGYDYLARRVGDPVDRAPDEDVTRQGPIIIAGVGRFGQTVNQLANANGLRTTVLDADINAISRLRRIGVKAFLGDPTRPELLQAAGLNSAEALVVAIDSPEKVTQLVRLARRRRPDLFIVARARDRIHAFSLYQAGASAIVRETFDSSLRAGRYVLQRMGVPEEEAHRRTRAFYRFDRNSTRELALVWDPDVPIEKNEAYIDLVRQINSEMDIGLGKAYDEISGIGSETIPQKVEPPVEETQQPAPPESP